MSAIIRPERPDSADAVLLITELEAHLEPLYPQASRHGFRVEQLLREAVAFFVMRHDGTPAGCGGVKLFGTAYGEIKRMYVRPQFRGLGLGKLMLHHLADYARQQGVVVLRLETSTTMAAWIPHSIPAVAQRLAILSWPSQFRATARFCLPACSQTTTG